MSDNPGLVRIIAAFCLLGVLAAMVSPARAEDAPRVRVASPPGNAYVISASGSKKKLLVVVEITDVSGAGIEVDKAGVPRFVDPGHNVDLFAGNIVEKNTYMNKLGQEVIQLVSLVPVEKLQTDSRITPPIDFEKIRPSEGERQFPVPLEEMIPCAKVRFQVRDLKGAPSDREAGLMTIGFANGLWVPSAGAGFEQRQGPARGPAGGETAVGFGSEAGADARAWRAGRL